MSRIADAILAEQGVERRIVTGRYPALATVSIEGRLDDLSTMEYEVKYSLRTTIGMDMWIRETIAGGLAQAMDVTRRHVIEEIFGEFRLPMQDVERALWDRDFEGAALAMIALRESMFNTRGAG